MSIITLEQHKTESLRNTINVPQHHIVFLNFESQLNIYLFLAPKEQTVANNQEVPNSRPPEPSRPPPPARPAPTPQYQPPPTQQPNSGGLFSSIRGGAGSFLKNLKDTSSKVMQTVQQ